MRNFLIANSYTAAKIDALAKGQLCMYDLSSGKPDQTKVPVKAGLMVVGNTEGNRVLPIYNNKLSITYKLTVCCQSKCNCSI